jgi:hypothetical protein
MTQSKVTRVLVVGATGSSGQRPARRRHLVRHRRLRHPGALDGVRDRDNLPLDAEPIRVIRDIDENLGRRVPVSGTTYEDKRQSRADD